MKDSKNIGIIGAGYWGLNLIRNFYKLKVLKHVVDKNSNNMVAVKRVAPDVNFSNNYKSLFLDKSINAVVIATPAKSHYKIVKEALMHDKHVFVEKPLCLEFKDGKKLHNLANKRNLKLMVGHLLLYHPAYKKMREKINKGLIGKIRYIYSNRLSLGKLRKEEDVLWSFAPHDISMILDLVQEKLISVEAYGGGYINKKIKDTSVTLLKFSNNVKAHIFVSWLHPYKDQRLVVIGDKGMIVFADVLDNNNKLLFYNHDVRWEGNFPVINKAKGKKIAFNYRNEPLKLECEAFIDWIKLDIKPPSHSAEGLAVLKVLELAKNKLRKW